MIDKDFNMDEKSSAKKAEDFVLILVISKNMIDTKCDTIYNIIRGCFECQNGINC